MNAEEQRIAIAEACGWTHFQPDTIQYTARRADGKWGEIPDYPNDLNAMHEAEKALLSMDGSCGYWETYSNALTAKLGCVDIFHATAAQRLEAFLKTLNLWTDDT